MAKKGIDSFLMNCHTNENLSEIEAAYGIKGFAIIVRLWQKIYSEKGYYCEWSERSPLLFLANWFGGNSGVDLNLIKEVVSTALKNGIFDKELYEKYDILTSDGIQKRYFDVVIRRSEIEVIEENLLVSVANFNGNVSKNNISACKNTKNVCRNETSKVKESKEKKSNNTLCKAEALALFETLWKIYPNKKGKTSVTDKDKLKLLEIGLEEMTRAIDRYKRYIEANKDWYKPLNGSTFFKGRYLDYIGDDYEEPKQSVRKSGFNNFQQNDYDFDELEKELLSN